MRTEERKFITSLQKWLHHNCNWSGPIEAKVVYGKLFNYKSGFKPHQLPNLMSAQKGCVTYKISDVTSAAGFGQNPWDLDVYYKAKSFVAIQWVGEKTFFLIDPSELLHDIDAGIKSLSRERAELLYYLKGELK